MIKYIAGRPGMRQNRNTSIWSKTGFQVSHICCYESTSISARALESSQYKLYTIYYPKKSNQLVVCTSNPPYIALLTADSYNLVTVAIRREIDIKPTKRQHTSACVSIRPTSRVYQRVAHTRVTYADVCWRMLVLPLRMLTYADVFRRMLAYADVR